MGYVPVEVVGAPVGVEPLLVEVAGRRGCGNVGVWGDALLEVFPHVEYDAAVVPPVAVVLFCFFEVGFPGVHRRGLFFMFKTFFEAVCHYLRFFKGGYTI